MTEAGLEEGRSFAVCLYSSFVQKWSEGLCRPEVIDLTGAFFTEMGCGTSTAKDNEENEGNKFDFSRRNTIVQRPNVVVEIGKGVKKIDQERRIVFIFGRSTRCSLNFYSFFYCSLSLRPYGKIVYPFLYAFIREYYFISSRFSPWGMSTTFLTLICMSNRSFGAKIDPEIHGQL